jgi:hypothetical protein
MMSELLAKVAEILGAPESLVQRSAEARAEASGNTVDEVLHRQHLQQQKLQLKK